jgi:hypothetical protein
MRTIPRAAGVGLLVYGVGVTVAFMSVGGPGGDYEPAGVSAYIASSHWPVAFGLSYVGALASVGLMVFGLALKSVGEGIGSGVRELLWGLAVAGTATSVVGGFVTAGLDVAMAEGGSTVQNGVPHPVVYTVTEIGNLLSVCGPAFFAGLMALLLAARAPLPTWLRACSAVAGVCGILAPLFFTLFVFVLWTIVAGVTLLARRPAERRVMAPAVQP